MEELFFFLYQLKTSREDCMTLPIHERKWLIQRFIEEKRNEHDAMERARKTSR